MGNDNSNRFTGIKKSLTGIRGLDEITDGGLPYERSTLVCGGAGCGKTLLAMEFIIHGARDFDEPGVYLAFEESEQELNSNFASLGFDLPELVAQKKLIIDCVEIDRSGTIENGAYTLDGLFARLESSINEIGAKRVVIDSIQTLFLGLSNESVLRSELHRLFHWLKERRVTCVITGEQGTNSLTRSGLEEYVSDCVIFLDHRIENQVATRRLRIVKYRGTTHGTNEYPAIIGDEGLNVIPISSVGFDYAISTARISSGVERLDTMLGGQGYYRGSSILVTGTAGTGKSSLASAFADAACKRGERCLYWSSEEAPNQMFRNMATIGHNLEAHMQNGLLMFRSVRPTLHGLENHLANIYKWIESFKPEIVVMDPITNLSAIANDTEVKLMLTRLIDYLKSKGITALFVNLISGNDVLESSVIGVSSLMDTWLLVRMIESAQERNRVLYILKSRGMPHSNQMREFVLSSSGIKLLDVYVGPGEVFTGTARLNQQARDYALAQLNKQKAEQHDRELLEEHRALEAQIAAIKTRLHNIEFQRNTAKEQEDSRVEILRHDSEIISNIRMADRT